MSSLIPDTNDFYYGAGDTGYQIDYSCRFNDDDSAYSRDTSPTTGDSNKTFTLFGWFRLGVLGTRRTIWGFDDGLGNDQFIIEIGTDDRMNIIMQDTSNVTQLEWKTTQVFRDPHSWYHFVWTVDTTPTTPVSRLWINRAEVTDFTKTTDSLAQNDAFSVGSSIARVAFGARGAGTNVWDGYLAQIGYQDGVTVSDASNYLDVDANDVPQAKDVTGLTYGTAGRLFEFGTAPGTGNGAGTDTSGNGEHHTDSGLTSDDQVTDTPTDPYMTFSPLWNGTLATLSDGNLTASRSAADTPAYGSWTFTSGLWAFDLTWDAGATGEWAGVCSTDYIAGKSGLQDDVAGDAQAWVYKPSTGNKSNGNIDPGVAYGSGITTGQKLTVFLDMDQGAGSNKMWISENGTIPNSGDPAAGTNAMYSNLPGEVTVLVQGRNTTTGTWTLNCGQTGALNDSATGFNEAKLANVAVLSETSPITGSFTGNVNAGGPLVILGYPPDQAGTSTINGNTITWGTDADPIANGFKLRTSSSSYNASGTNNFSIAIDPDIPFGGEGKTPVPAQSA